MYIMHNPQKPVFSVAGAQNVPASPFLRHDKGEDQTYDIRSDDRHKTDLDSEPHAAPELGI